MRIIHTSDWHLGQHFMGKSREPEHRDFLNWLLEFIEESRADALVVAGDIFDTGIPPSYARTLYNEFIVKLQQTGCSQAVILGGNHDSASTLNEARAILACLNTQVFAGISQEPGDHVIMLKDRDGNPGLLLCAVPFLRPMDLVKSMAGQSGRDKQLAMGQAISSFYDQVFQVAKSHRDKGGKDLPIMATGHLTVVGGKSSESVRDIYIGSLDAFPVAGFPGADYIALGHLHRSQAVKGLDHIQYSGSPIPLSFDEAGKEKQVLQVDFAQGALDRVTRVPVPCFRQLVCVKGSLEDIKAGIEKLLQIREGSSQWLQGRTLWLEAEVATDDYLTDLQDRILAMIQVPEDLVKGAGVDPLIDLLRVRRKRGKNRSGLARESREKLEELNPKDVFLRRLANEDLDEDQIRQLTGLFDEIMARVQGEEI